MLVVADTSPLRYLIAIGEVGILPVIFGQIGIPGAVCNELTAESTPAAVKSLVESRPEWLHVRDPQAFWVDRVKSSLDIGERSALALALELKADLVLVDDAAGRVIAKALGVRFTGTVGVLRLAAERELVKVPETLSRLRNSGFYVDEAVLRGAFGLWLVGE